MRICTLVMLLSLALCQPVIAGSEKGTFELVGTLVPGEPRMFRTVYPTISLHSVGTPFSARALANGKGEFKLKNLRTGMYTLVAVLPQVRVLRKTVDIGPTFADARGKIYLTIPFDRPPPNRMRYTVSASQLAIPDGALSEYRKAQDYLAKGDSERGVACLKKIVETTPQFAAAWNSLGNVASQSGQFEEAEIYYRESLNHNPSSYRTLLSLGGTLISQKKTSESLQVFVRAVKLRPEDPEGQARLGLNYLMLEDLDKAKEHLEEAKRIEPGHFSCPQLFLAQIHARRGDAASSIEELEEFLKLHPDLEMAPSVRDTIKQLRTP
jgi:tetratricopeptide (TPR) repeat protein